MIMLMEKQARSKAYTYAKRKKMWQKYRKASNKLSFTIIDLPRMRVPGSTRHVTEENDISNNVKNIF